VTQANARNRAAAAGFALSSAAVLCAYALGVEPYRLQVARITLRPRRLPPALDGLSVLLLADLHMEKWGRRERLLADLLDSLPDPTSPCSPVTCFRARRGWLPHPN
jgi:predicted MPP superfamily phosphohydrolase